MEDIATWGVDNTLTYGIVQSDDYSISSKTSDVKNELGQRVRVHQYDQEKTATYTIVTTGTLPQIGDAITINGDTLYISSIEHIENNHNFQTAKISCKGTKEINSIVDVEE